MRYAVEIYSDEKERCLFLEWLEKVASADERRIRKRILRIENGNLGDYKSLGEGVFELRFFFGPGYRVYFGFQGDSVVLLLSGGSKGSQDQDIRLAKRIWKEIDHG